MSPTLPVSEPVVAAQPLSVSELTEQIKGVVEASFPSVWVSGEISNLARPQSGHVYFTLKDEAAQIRAVMWRSTASRLPFDVNDGLNVVCRGRIEVYRPRGIYQIVIEALQPQGIGGLELALRRLRDKLAREGLFDARRKQTLPAFPRRIAIVTSPSGAAIRDFLQVVQRRWQGMHVLIVPTRVQGDGAAQEIAAAVKTAARIRPAPDVVVVARGGGSLEDLWAFNEEIVVRAVAGCPIPVVSGVGHEIDVTLTDLAADVRALTPSEAAEHVVPSAEDVRAGLRGVAVRLAAALRHRARLARTRLDAVARHTALRRPTDRIHQLARMTDELAARANRAVRERYRESRQRIDALAGKLDSLSPLGVLRRGYSLTVKDGKPVADAAHLTEHDEIETRFARGRAISRVLTVRAGDA